MKNILEFVEVITAIVLVVSILLQHRGSGLGGSFGGQDLSYRSRRGIEQLLFRTTILFSTIFLVVLIARLFI